MILLCKVFRAVFQAGFLVLAISLTSCQKFETKPPSDSSSWTEAAAPQVSVDQATDLTYTGAKIKINLTSTGGRKIYKVLFCYSATHSVPDTLDSKVSLGSTNYPKEFLVILDNLSQNTRYYYRVFVVNMKYSAWSGQKDLTTPKDKKMAEVTTGSATVITTTSAALSGTLVSSGEGYSSVTQHGHVWSVKDNPTTNDNKTQLGTKSTGTFSSSLTGLQKSTKYYYRAYATNGYATSYGVLQSFITNGSPAVTTDNVVVLTSTSAKCGGEVTSSGGFNVTARGVCWSTSQNPVITGTHTNDGSGTGAFISSIANLTENTKYYVRAYATNSDGTAYGPEKSFISGIISDMDANTYKIIKIGTQYWLDKNLQSTKYNDGSSIPLITENNSWAALTTPGYCWYDNKTTSKADYGALYNWYAVNTGKLCPAGWHVPNETEWGTIVTYLGGLTAAGGKMKETGTTHWTTPNTGATNSSGFTAVPGGWRSYLNGTFGSQGNESIFWSQQSVTGSTTNAYRLYLLYNSAGAVRDNHYKSGGFSVRCTRD